MMFSSLRSAALSASRHRPRSLRAAAAWTLRSLALIVLGSYPLGSHAQTVDISLVSQAAPGGTAAAASTGGALATPDGRFALFYSVATNLVPGQVDSNSAEDVFLFDRVSGTTVLVSRAGGAATTTANGQSFPTAISADGSQVLFQSAASNVVAGVTDNNARTDAFLFDRLTGSTTLVSHASASAAVTANFASLPRAISADGSQVVFDSQATNLVAGVVDNSFHFDVFLFDRASGGNTLVSRALGSATATANDHSFGIAISADGSQVLFTSRATNVISGVTDNNGAGEDIFLFDRASNSTTLVSRALDSANATPNGPSGGDVIAISADGSQVLFPSSATDVVPGVTDNNGTVADVFLFNRISGTTTLVSRALGSANATPNGGSSARAISADGSKMLFESAASNVISGANDFNGTFDVFVFDRTSASTILVSRRLGSPSNTANSGSVATAISADGSKVLFRTLANDVVAGVTDSNLRNDVFLFDRISGSSILVSRALGSATTPANGDSISAALSADGGQVLFDSFSTNLIAGLTDNNGTTSDVFLFDRASGSATLVSSAQGTTTTNLGSTPVAISVDGSHVLFQSAASNVVAGVTDTNGFLDVFVLDRTSGSTTLVSRALGSATAAPNGQSFAVAISADGSKVLFHSQATNVLAGVTDNNGTDDVFLFDRASGITTLVSRALGSATATPNNLSIPVAMSADGSQVLFRSVATNVLAAVTDNNGTDDVFLFDRASASTTLVSRELGSAAATPNGRSVPAAISADGSQILFQSQASNVMTGVTDTNGTHDVFLFDRASGGTTLVSRALGSTTTTPNGQSLATAISADASQVLFSSFATNVMTGVTDTNSGQDVFLFDRASGGTTLVSRALGSATATPNGRSVPTALTANGSQVLFFSFASNVIAGVTDTNGTDDVFVFDRSSDSTTLVSRALGSATATPNSGSSSAAISADGSQLLFSSSATNVRAGVTDTNGAPDVFLFDRAGGSTTLLSRARGSATATANGLSSPTAISADGNQVLFSSAATNVIVGLTDINLGSDAFLASLRFLDFGDAPASYGTVLADGGARHELVGALLLGASRDAEPDSASPRDGSGDDVTGSDDEDGAATIPSLVRGSTVNITITASAVGALNAFADWNRDGDFDLPAEQVATNLALTAGSNTLVLSPPLDSIVGASFLRLRASTASGLGPVGFALDGEVEDHTITIAGNSFTVTATASGNGGISPPSQLVEDGGEATFIVTPAANNNIVGVTGTTCTPVDNGDGTWIATSITSACAVTATFDANPTVVSIEAIDANPATSSPVRFRITFSETVNGVDSTDMQLVPGGTVSGQAITSIACVNAICNVTASIAEGDGSLGLNLVDNDSIVDLAGFALGGTGTTGSGNGSFTGQVYTIDLGKPGPPIAPVVTSITRLDPNPTAGPTVRYAVTFSEAVTGVEATDFSLARSGTVAGSSITGTSGTAGNYIVTASTGTGTGTLRLDVVDDDSIADLNNNRLGGIGLGNGNFVSGDSYTVDTVNPILLFKDGFEAMPTP